MKIPETTANVGAYYGNEENGQWQPNGVIIDSGVGGGVVGSGDAGFVHHAPVYPVPRPHIPSPGYVMAGAYYEAGGAPPFAPPPHDDFADYMWMENEEEFDKQVMQQLEEEALMEQCIEAMLEDEQRELRQRPAHTNGHTQQPMSSNGSSGLSLEETVSRSTLNPLAAEFVPTRARVPASTPTSNAPTEGGKAASATSVSAAEDVQRLAPDTPSPAPDTTQDDSQSSDTPEVSAADVQPIREKTQEKRPKDPKKDVKKPTAETKKPVKVVEQKKIKPTVVKSEPKVLPKKEVKKDVKPVKSEEQETCVEIQSVSATEVCKSLSQEEDLSKDVPSGPKPINYAAAAKANKPKKMTPPPTEKSVSPPTVKTEKPVTTTKSTDKIDKSKSTDKIPPKDKVKTDKPRKNSTK